MRIRSFLEDIVGTTEAHRLQRRERGVARRPLSEAIAAAGARLPPDAVAPTDEPLFVLAAGWRSGSTLVQRLINSGTTYFVWGEPYSRADLVPRLADSIRPLTEAWPRREDILQDGGSLGDRWTANLHPGLETLLDSHRALLRTLLAPPAGSSVGCGWGLKEVRLSADHALYLYLLFPRARFIFLVRDPLDAYASYKTWRSWYVRWPEGQIRSARAYGRLWSSLAGGFLEVAPSVGGTVLRYEDLTAGGPAAIALGQIVGTRLDDGVLANRITGHDGHPARPSSYERRAIARRTGAVARRLDYVVDR